LITTTLDSYFCTAIGITADGYVPVHRSVYPFLIGSITIAVFPNSLGNSIYWCCIIWSYIIF